MLHHVSIRTADIFRSIAFYERLEFVVHQRFQTGETLACWMESEQGGRIELIQMLEPKPAPEIWLDEHYTGYYHLSLLVLNVEESLQTLKNHEVPILLEPTEQQIGTERYRVAFVLDPDRLPVELIEKL
jgi:catechol 2,3-dioxygenase-like lactoylglutathione lyase family enzyme